MRLSSLWHIKSFGMEIERKSKSGCHSFPGCVSLLCVIISINNFVLDGKWSMGIGKLFENRFQKSFRLSHTEGDDIIFANHSWFNGVLEFWSSSVPFLGSTIVGCL